MDEGTYEDYQLLHEREAEYFSGTPNILAQMASQQIPVRIQNLS